MFQCIRRQESLDSLCPPSPANVQDRSGAQHKNRKLWRKIPLFKRLKNGSNKTASHCRPGEAAAVSASGVHSKTGCSSSPSLPPSYQDPSELTVDAGASTSREERCVAGGGHTAEHRNGKSGLVPGLLDFLCSNNDNVIMLQRSQCIMVARYDIPLLHGLSPSCFLGLCKLLEQGAICRFGDQDNVLKINSRSQFGRTAQTLINSRGHFYDPNGDAPSPLHIASTRGLPQVVHFLLTTGADTGRVFNGRTPLSLVVSWLQAHCVTAQAVKIEAYCTVARLLIDSDPALTSKRHVSHGCVHELKPASTDSYLAMAQGLALSSHPLVTSLAQYLLVHCGFLPSLKCLSAQSVAHGYHTGALNDEDDDCLPMSLLEFLSLHMDPHGPRMTNAQSTSTLLTVASVSSFSDYRSMDEDDDEDMEPLLPDLWLD